MPRTRPAYPKEVTSLTPPRHGRRRHWVQEAWRPGQSSPTGGARQFLPGIRRNRRPELTFGNEAAFCYGFGKAMA